MNTYERLLAEEGPFWFSPMAWWKAQSLRPWKDPYFTEVLPRITPHGFFPMTRAEVANLCDRRIDRKIRILAADLSFSTSAQGRKLLDDPLDQLPCVKYNKISRSEFYDVLLRAVGMGLIGMGKNGPSRIWRVPTPDRWRLDSASREYVQRFTADEYLILQREHLNYLIDRGRVPGG